MNSTAMTPEQFALRQVLLRLTESVARTVLVCRASGLSDEECIDQALRIRAQLEPAMLEAFEALADDIDRIVRFNSETREQGQALN